MARFRSQVGGRTRVLLMPSTRDVHHHPVLPQPPLEAAGGAMALANPATLRCNEVVLGATSADWLMGCNREEVSRAAPGQQEERLPALAAHLPAQRCYYPLFPPPAGVPLDCSRSTAALQMPCTPDLLLTPSDLAPFAKLCPVHMLPKEAATPGGEAAGEPAAAPAPGGNAVCVNPGRLAKGASGAPGGWAACLGVWFPALPPVLLPHVAASHLISLLATPTRRRHLCPHPHPAAARGAGRGRRRSSAHQRAGGTSAGAALPGGDQARVRDAHCVIDSLLNCSTIAPECPCLPMLQPIRMCCKRVP